ncbi:sensor histidine kinase [Hydrogenophaga aquatica]
MIPANSNSRGISLFWRTFLFLSALLFGCILAWFQTFRALEEEPRALQSARQLASLVNLTRAALMHADAIARVSLVKTLVDQENVRIAVREPSDTFSPYDRDTLSRHIQEALASRLGGDTIVAREVNGFPGLWIGFNIGEETYWLLADPERIGSVEGTTWLVWLAIAANLSLVGAVLMARLINRPLKKLSIAAARVREGDFQASHLDEHVPTSEIREVNIGFNRMAERLHKAEAERALMLAGISHDLRTPLARLRLETEMSVSDETARTNMAADIEQVTAIIDKFLDYARADHAKLEDIPLAPVLEAALQRQPPDELIVTMEKTAQDARVRADPVELRRVIVNLLENARRYARTGTEPARINIATARQGQWVEVTLRDYGPGVPEEQVKRLTEPFFRGDEARTAATGSGLGLAIVSKTIAHMGGEFELANHPEGGLIARLHLRAV